MMQTKTISAIFLTLCLTGSCKSPQNVTEKPNQPRWSVQAGINKGGITENTAITSEPGTEIDAFSGATQTGVNAGIRAAVPIKSNALETGLDIMYNPQTFTYNDPINHFRGERELNLTQIMAPLTWNFGVLNRPLHGSIFEIKLGPLLQYNILETSDSGSNLPDYNVNKLSGGFTLGISATPIVFDNASQLGIYLEGYRGSQIYEDFYNQSKFEEPGSSFVKFGLIYRFKRSSDR